MSEKITITTEATAFPKGTQFAGQRLSILKSDGSEAVPAVILANAPYEVTDDLPAGAYTLIAQAIDTNGAALGEPVPTALTVEGVMVDLPQSITVATV